MVYIIIIAVILIYGIFFAPVIAKREKEKIHNLFSSLAEEFQLKMTLPKLGYWEAFFTPAHPSLNGIIADKYALEIRIRLEKSKNSSTEYLLLKLDCNNLDNHRLKLKRENFTHKIGKKIGLQKDIELRDPEFDNQFIVKSDQHLFVKELLADPDLREEFISNKDAFENGFIKLEGDSLYVDIHLSIDNPNTFNNTKIMIRLAILIAERLDEMVKEQNE